MTLRFLQEAILDLLLIGHPARTVAVGELPTVEGLEHAHHRGGRERGDGADAQMIATGDHQMRGLIQVHPELWLPAAQHVAAYTA